MTIGSDGTLSLDSGTGINFGGIQTEASGTGITSSQTILDHYEEGEWTPAYSISTGSPTLTYHSNDTKGYYTRIGNICYIHFCIRLNAASSLPSTGTVKITGLPFTCKDISIFQGQTVGMGGAIAYANRWFSTVLTDQTIQAAAVADDTTMLLYRSSAGLGFNNMVGAELRRDESAGILEMFGSYIVKGS